MTSDRRMFPPPPRFAGSLDEFYDVYVLPNLPSPEIVEHYHRLLAEYCSAKDPLFLVRQVSKAERKQIYATDYGDRFKATDNAPAWWMHHTLFHEHRVAADAFATMLFEAPGHFFDVARTVPDSISAAGWHIAHIFPVKDGDTDFRRWPRAGLTRRFIRNVHPCNYFFVAKPQWQRWGGDERVIAFFVDRYASRYETVWAEFLGVADADVSIRRVHGPVHYEYEPSVDSANARASRRRAAILDETTKVTGGEVAVSYSSSRLLFKAKAIEPLTASERFRVITPSGTFEMSKADFYRAFPNVVQSRSYREAGVYHYRNVPAAALEFLR